mmetsp:Transcript_8909/g.17438  ORF Transcript_8909/g.17438 Transcript_8909/m.17438 type:complete len:122 (-) Transcript_8909:313-678(-)
MFRRVGEGALSPKSLCALLWAGILIGDSSGHLSVKVLGSAPSFPLSLASRWQFGGSADNATHAVAAPSAVAGTHSSALRNIRRCVKSLRAFYLIHIIRLGMGSSASQLTTTRLGRSLMQPR